MANSLYLPALLSDEQLGALLKEAEKIKENPDTEIPLLMQAISDLALNAGKRALEHQEIAEALETYLRYLSLEKLHRLGIIKEYEQPSPKELFLPAKEITLTLLTPPSA